MQGDTSRSTRRGIDALRPAALVTLLAAALTTFPLLGRAALIEGFGIGEGPTVQVDSLLVAYDEADDGLFVLDLGSQGLLDGGDAGIWSIDGTGVNIILSIDGTGRLSGGTFQLSGVIDDLGYDSGTLITGEAVDFGFAVSTGNGPLTDELQLVFAITGGDAAGLFDGTLAVSLTGTGFPGGWSLDWVNDGEGFSIAGNAIPLPGALTLMLGGLAGLGVFRRRRR